MGSSSRRLLNQSTHSSVANSTASQRPPRPAPMDHLGLVEPVDRLGERVVVAVADAADRGLDAGLGQALGVLDRDVLRRRDPSDGRGRHRVTGCRSCSACSSASSTKLACARAAHPPADDAAGVHVDDEGDVDEALPGRDVGEVRDPQQVRALGAWNCRLTRSSGHGAALSLHRRAHRLAADDALQAQIGSSGARPCSGPPRCPSRFICRQTLPHAIDLEVLVEDALDLGFSAIVPLGPRRQLRRIALAGRHGVSRSTGRSAAPCRSARPRRPRDARR